MTRKAAVSRDPDMAGVYPALVRAARKARLIARQTNTPCYVMQDGIMVDVAKPKRKQAKRQNRDAD